MGLFGPKYKRIEDAEKDAKNEPPPETPQKEESSGGGGGDSKLAAEITKIKAQLDQFAEMRKVNSERFTRINEQVGELRGMIMDTNRSMQDMEIKTVKAVDLVEAVQPDKLMVEVRKQDAKVESLKAAIESNETMMKSIMSQLKDLRHQINVFRGVEQVVKLSNDTKTELMNIKKVQATVERHADKVETIFSESQKKFQEFESLGGKIGGIDKQLKTVAQQSDQVRVKIQTLAQKKEVEDLIKKINDFEKHVGNVMDLLTKRANDLPRDINHRFTKLEKSMNKAFENKLQKATATKELLEKLEEKAPEIAKQLNVAEAKEGEDENKMAAGPPTKPKEGLLKKVLGKKKEGEGEAPKEGGGEEEKKEGE